MESALGPSRPDPPAAPAAQPGTVTVTIRKLTGQASEMTLPVELTVRALKT
jgi:hypothetical protein